MRNRKLTHLKTRAICLLSSVYPVGKSYWIQIFVLVIESMAIAGFVFYFYIKAINPGFENPEKSSFYVTVSMFFAADLFFFSGAVFIKKLDCWRNSSSFKLPLYLCAAFISSFLNGLLSSYVCYKIYSMFSKAHYENYGLAVLLFLIIIVVFLLSIVLVFLYRFFVPKFKEVAYESRK